MSIAPTEVIDQLEAARKDAVGWLKIQFNAGLHLVNTGSRERINNRNYRLMKTKGESALKLIEAIKREYPNR